MTTKLRVPEADVVMLESPTTFFTIDGAGEKNPGSRCVIEQMQTYVANDVSCVVLSSSAEIDTLMIDRARAVAIYDGKPRNEFSPRLISSAASSPQWASGVLWGVEVCGEKVSRSTRTNRCAQTTLAHFGKRFRLEIDNKNMPWGTPKWGTQGPSDVVRLDPDAMQARQLALNSGPDLAHAIASKSFARDLPKGSRISWVRIPETPLGYDGPMMRSVVRAMRNLEIASGKLVLVDEAVRKTILAGVHIKDKRLEDIYIDPGVPCFSVARPDIHWKEDGLNVSENDEMPGGMPELVHIDAAYGINEDRWTRFFDWLTSEGPLVFVVSAEWSECYITETAWLVDHLQKKGYDAQLLTTDRIDELSITPAGVFLGGKRVGTVWRQFPIFETVGALADLVVAAHEGRVRVMPEFAHFGGKAWFHIFASHEAWYREHLDAEDFALLKNILPDSHFVHGPESFPCTVGSVTIDSASAFASLTQSDRDNLVLKICGANSLAARSYGVLIGAGISAVKMAGWVEERLRLNEPFLIQERFHTGVVRMPVWNTSSNSAEIFNCRLLMRPWAYGDGEIVSIHGCAVPQEFHKVHGMTAMAVVPVELDEAA